MWRDGTNDMYRMGFLKVIGKQSGKSSQNRLVGKVCLPHTNRE